MHNPRLDAIRRDDTFAALEGLKSEGKIRHYAVAVGPDLGWQDEGIAAVAERRVPAQIIYSILEQDPARAIIDVAREQRRWRFHDECPHAVWACVDGTYTKDTVLDDIAVQQFGPPISSQVDVDAFYDPQTCEARFPFAELRRDHRAASDPILFGT